MICADRFRDAFVHSADVFEDFKRLGAPQYMVATLEPDAVLEEVLTKLREHASKTLYVSAIFVPGTSIGWVDPTVKLISNGESFCTIGYMLEHTGYILPTNETIHAQTRTNQTAVS